jgi:GT2 family glycosyltransferase
MKTETQVSLVVPIHNSAATISDCLTAVTKFTTAPAQVILIDDGSIDNSAELASRFSFQLVRLEANLGAAAARNRGAALACSQIVFFLDADIVAPPDTIEHLVRIFDTRPDISAVFGSYQKETVPKNFVSDYKNLLHHFTHQTSAENAATFCAGFGAIRREVFEAYGGFNESQLALEDIELGYRLHRAGRPILLDKTLQFTHCKTYSLGSLVVSDVLNRAIPWTQLMLGQRIFRNDLNTKNNNIASVVAAFALAAAPLWAWWVPAGAIIVLALLAAFIFLNRDFYDFVYRERGAAFLLKTIVINWFGYIYSGIGLGLGILLYAKQRVESHR